MPTDRLVHPIEENQKFPSSIYLKTNNFGNHRRKVLLTIVFILIFLLGASIFFAFQKQLAKKEILLSPSLEIAQAKLEEGKALFGLNEARARIVLNEAKEIVEKEKFKLKNEKAGQKKLDDFLKQINETLETVAKIYRTEGFVFFDLNLLKEGAEGRILKITFNDLLYVWDGKNSLVYKINFKSKQSEIAGQVKDGLLLTAYDQKAFVLTSEEIVETEGKSKIKNDGWGEIKEMISYAGNIYLLDIGQNQIWKYPIGEEGFGGKRSYLALGVSPDFKKAVSLAINGAVWVLFENGAVVKYIQGRPDVFNIKGLDKGLSRPTVLFTSDESKNLYILDKGNNRIVVLDKSGSYQGQYLWEKIGEADDFVVNEEEKKLWVLAGNKIYLIEMK